jgi:cell division protein FtsL
MEMNNPTLEDVLLTALIVTIVIVAVVLFLCA